MKRSNTIRGFTLGVGACVLVLVGSSIVRADPIPAGGQSEHVKVIGFSALGGRYGAFKMALNHPVNGRWYLYMGHSFDLGWSILDVTDPVNPKLVKFIPFDGPKDWITSQVTVHDNLMITSLDRRNPADGPDVIFWDISDPVNPTEITRWAAAPEAPIAIPILAENTLTSPSAIRASGIKFSSSSTSAIQRVRKRSANGGSPARKKVKPLLAQLAVSMDRRTSAPTAKC